MHKQQEMSDDDGETHKFRGRHETENVPRNNGQTGLYSRQQSRHCPSTTLPRDWLAKCANLTIEKRLEVALIRTRHRNIAKNTYTTVNKSNNDNQPRCPTVVRQVGASRGSVEGMGVNMSLEIMVK